MEEIDHLASRVEALETRLQADNSSRKDDYERYKGRMEHEDNLIATRVNWLVSSQSFLMTPYVLLHNDPHTRFIIMLEYVIIALGLISSWLTYVSIAAAIHSMVRLKGEYTRYVADHGSDDNLRPEIGLDRPEAVRGLAAPRGFIFLFITVWVFLFAVSISTHELSRPNWPGIAGSFLFAVAVAVITFCTETYVTHGVRRSL